jgi:Phytanoyl-CoA dioxygenase (PhyH)
MAMGNGRELELTRNSYELRANGYTLLEDRKAKSLAPVLRRDILELCRETKGSRHGRAAALLLGRRPSFTQALMLPSLMALVEGILGKGMILSQLAGSVRVAGSPPLGMHVDNSWFPEPFPDWEITCTACWVLDDFTQEGGCTYVVPRSHLERRHPPIEHRNRFENARPLDAPVGSIWIWTGGLWHGNYPRAIDGERIVLHMTFVRLGIQPVEDYRHLDSLWLRAQPAAVAGLLGRNSLFGTTNVDNGGVDPVLAVETYRAVHGRDGY